MDIQTRAKSLNLSKEGKHRLAWFEYYEKHGNNARLTCRHFGISPGTFYRWKKRYDPNAPLTLEDNKKNRRPKKLRESTTPPAVMDRIKELKEKHPSLGKYKLCMLLKEEGIYISASTIVRIISRLKKSGILKVSLVTKTNKGTKTPTRHEYSLPIGFQEYISLLQLWKK